NVLYWIEVLNLLEARSECLNAVEKLTSWCQVGILNGGKYSAQLIRINRTTTPHTRFLMRSL
ncbi:hypothetical protein BDV98DRAFT_573788, partial [Pterulicium gracile]